MIEILALATVIAGVTTGVVQAVKHSVNLKKNYIPLLALGVGLMLGAFSFPFSDLEIASRLWAGGMSGLASVGLFELGNQRDGETKGEKNED